MRPRVERGESKVMLVECARDVIAADGRADVRLPLKRMGEQLRRAGFARLRFQSAHRMADEGSLSPVPLHSWSTADGHDRNETTYTVSRLPEEVRLEYGFPAERSRKLLGWARIGAAIVILIAGAIAGLWWAAPRRTDSPLEFWRSANVAPLWVGWAIFLLNERAMEIVRWRLGGEGWAGAFPALSIVMSISVVLMTTAAAILIRGRVYLNGLAEIPWGAEWLPAFWIALRHSGYVAAALLVLDMQVLVQPELVAFPVLFASLVRVSAERGLARSAGIRCDAKLDGPFVERVRGIAGALSAKLRGVWRMPESRGPRPAAIVDSRGALLIAREDAAGAALAIGRLKAGSAIADHARLLADAALCGGAALLLSRSGLSSEQARWILIGVFLSATLLSAAVAALLRRLTERRALVFARPFMKVAAAEAPPAVADDGVPPLFRFTIQYTPADLVPHYRLLCLRIRTKWTLLVTAGAVVVGVGSLYGWFYPWAAPVAVFAAFYAWMQLYRWPECAAGQVFEGQPDLKQPVRLDFHEGGLRSASASATGSCGWNHFEEICETPSSFLLIHGLSSHVVPKRIFEAGDQMGRFREYLRAHGTLTDGGFFGRLC